MLSSKATLKICQLHYLRAALMETDPDDCITSASLKGTAVAARNRTHNVFLVAAC